MSGIPPWAVKGAKVVCIDARWIGPPSPLVEGGIYTIVGFAEPPKGRYMLGYYPPGLACVCLAEARNTDPLGFGGFAIERFRPLIEDSEQDGIEARIFKNKGLHQQTRMPSPLHAPHGRERA